jgi:hypothetical protein
MRKFTSIIVRVAALLALVWSVVVTLVGPENHLDLGLFSAFAFWLVQAGEEGLEHLASLRFYQQEGQPTGLDALLEAKAQRRQSPSVPHVGDDWRAAFSIKPDWWDYPGETHEERQAAWRKAGASVAGGRS